MVRMGSMRRAKRILLIAGMLVLSVAPTEAGLFGRRKTEAKPTAPAAVMTLNAVEIEPAPASRLVLRTSGSPVFNSYSPQPNQFVVDLTGASKAESLVIPKDLPAGITSITAEEVTEMGTRLTRVTVALSQPASLTASADTNMVLVPLPAPAVADVKTQERLPAVTTVAPVPEPVKTEPAVVAEPIALPKAKSLKKIEATGSAASVEVQLAADGDLTYNAFKLTSPARVVIDLNGVKDRLAKNVVNIDGGMVTKIRVSQFKSSPDPVTRVVFDLAQPADYHIAKVGDRLQVSFGEAAKIAAVDAPKLEPLTPPLSPPSGERVAEGQVRSAPAPSVEAVP